MSLVLGAQPLEDQDRVLNGRGLDLDRLEAALESRILFDIFTVFVQRGGPDALKLAATERRFDNIRSIHGPLGGTRADDGVQLVDEKNDVPVLADLIHHRLDALFKLAAVFRARHHKGEIECDDFFVNEELRDITGDNFLGQSFGDRRLADSGLPYKYGVILAAAAENLDDALDFLGTTDDGIKIPLPGKFSQIAAKGFKRGRLRLLAGGATGGDFLGLTLFISFLRRGEIGIEFLQHFVPRALEIDFQIFKNTCGYPLPLAE